ncbi:MAG: Gfo/Idh/MocA family oxidoreductase [Burkholderiales bacterium]|nr:Gfo/Idh/MocA family oxidoreductase [Anaerolineae bacterium]
MTLRAIVIGAGWAGEGHTLALQAAGVDVIALCGRTPEPAKAMASNLGLNEVRFNWQDALDEFRPDIVTIATPAKSHCEIAVAAARHGCHIMCDKPLALNAHEARQMLLAVEQAGVKHCYATTLRYSPQFHYVRRLLADGLIGRLTEIEWAQNGLLPVGTYYWLHQLDQGGGLLNQGFTHLLGVLLYVTGAKVQAASGVPHFPLKRVPIGPTLHDFRDLFNTPLDLEQAEWAAVDADFAFTVMLKLQMPDGHIVEVLTDSSGASLAGEPNHLLFHGESGVLKVSGPGFWPSEIRHLAGANQDWREMPIPQDILATLPQVEDRQQQQWNQLFQDFVADIRGESFASYPTFHDGWTASEIIDDVRSNRAWMPMPTL